VATSAAAANQRAVSHGAGALNIPTEAEAAPAPGEAKVDAAIHALAVRSLAQQRALEVQRGFGAARDKVASGTYAKDEAGVAALLGNP
jgi:hypothetical protein